MAYRLDLADRAARIGLNPMLSNDCIDEEQQDMMLEVQGMTGVFNTDYQQALEEAPNDATKEYNAAIKHWKSLGKYLFKSKQYEALEALDAVRIYKEQPRAKEIKTEYRECVKDIIDSVVLSTRRRAVLLSSATKYLEWNDIL